MVCAIDVIPPERGPVQQSDDGSRAPGTRGVHSISVAARLVGTGQQNLRAYEARGLVEPDRTDGGTRRYSEADIERLRRVARLLDDGLNLAGIVLVLELEAENRDLREENATLRDRDSRAGRTAQSKRPLR